MRTTVLAYLIAATSLVMALGGGRSSSVPGENRSDSMAILRSCDRNDKASAWSA